MKKIRIEIKWALIFIAVWLAWMVLEKITGLHGPHIDKHQYLTNLFAIPAVLIYVLALLNKKSAVFQGTITYRQAFTSGMIITAIVTAFAPLVQLIISLVITPEYFSNVIAYSVKTGYYKTEEEARDFFNLHNYMLQSTIGSFVMGTLTTAVVAFFVRTKSNG